MLEGKKREEINQSIAEIPDELLKRAYILDVIRKKLQLYFSGKIYKMFRFTETYTGFLETRLFNGFQVLMEIPPETPNYNYETLKEESNGNMS